MSCPISMPKGLCGLCPHSKQGVCDYPYSIEMKSSEIKDVTKRRK